MKTAGSHTAPTERAPVHSGSAIRWVAIAAMLMGFATAPLAASAKQSFNDRDVTSAVKTDLASPLQRCVSGFASEVVCQRKLSRMAPES